MSTENNMASKAKIAYGSRRCWATCQQPNVGAALFIPTNSASATQIIKTPTNDRFACCRSLPTWLFLSVPHNQTARSGVTPKRAEVFFPKEG